MRKLEMTPGQIFALFRDDGGRPDAHEPQSDIEALFWEHDGVEVIKWHHYLLLYERYFSPFRGRPVKMLEIGVSQGGSLTLWRRYFGKDAVIFGIDINPACAVFDGKDAQVRIGSQDDPDFLNQVVEEMGGVDIVLDDGSHQSKHIRASFSVLFPKLSEGGIYMIEDLHATYWPQFGGGNGTQSSFMNDIRVMIDDMHHWYHDAGERIRPSAGHLAGLHIHDSVAVMEKHAVPRPKVSARGKRTL